jgi:TM2 domain-containing membrane protein YozV
METARTNTHSLIMGYTLWIFGFFGAHRFYYGHRISGTIYLRTLGLLFVGWIIDLVLIPGMDKSADIRYQSGPCDYNIAWILLTFLGLLGIHRFYMKKWITGALFFLTGSFLGLGYVYDFWTLNSQIDELNRNS